MSLFNFFLKFLRRLLQEFHQEWECIKELFKFLQELLLKLTEMFPLIFLQMFVNPLLQYFLLKFQGGAASVG